jgi:hypothetical protein
MGYMEAIFSESSLNAMCELRGVFDPDRRANPGKVIPIHSCKEWNAAASARAVRAAGQETSSLSAEPERPSAR